MPVEPYGGEMDLEGGWDYENRTVEPGYTPEDQAVENPLGVRTLAGIKYRAWATTGRCHGGYCLPKIAQMLVEDYGLAPEEVTYLGAGSPLFTGRVKE